GKFREDLYYRLAVIELNVPALDEHCEDIPLLVAHFTRGLRRPLRFTQEALDVLMRMRWPGNVRQLRNLIAKVAVYADDETITSNEIQRVLAMKVAPVEEAMQRIAREALQLPIANKLGAVEEAMIAEALRQVDGNKSSAARLLGVHRKTIERRVSKG